MSKENMEDLTHHRSVSNLPVANNLSSSIV